MDRKTRVMIVDDQRISRRFFELTLTGSGRYEVVCALPSAFTADLWLLKEQIDLVLMDVLMNDGSNGLDAAEAIKREYPAVRIVVVTSMPEYSWIERARKIGVDSFWYKETDDVSVLDVMDRTMAGESIYPEAAPQVRLGLAERGDFTNRELEVLREITTGKSNLQVAQTLGITENTVKAHVRSLLQKTGLSSRTELAIRARVLGLALKLD